MYIYRVYWARVNWDARYTNGYNDIIEQGVYFADSLTLAKQLLPIEPKDGDIKIEKIFVFTEKSA
jgi:hypothetical protein